MHHNENGPEAGRTRHEQAANDAQQPRPEQGSTGPDVDSARPPDGYDDPLRRERNSGLVPPDPAEPQP